MIRDADVQAYQRDGVVCLRGLVAPSWVEELRSAFAEDEATLTSRAKDVADGRGRFFNDYNAWRQNERLRRFLFDGALGEAAARLFGARRVSLYGDHILTKYPDTVTRTEWHQDLPYWRVDGAQVGSFWIALDTVTHQTGTLEFVRGSHRSGRLYNPAGGVARSFPGHDWLPDIEAARADFDVVSYDLQPGDCTFHHSRMIHGAPGNASSDQVRRGYAVRLAGDDAVYRNRPTTRDVEEPGLPDGAILVSAGFPVLWRSSLAAAAG